MVSKEEGRFNCACWEMRVRPDDVEGVLLTMREQNPKVVIQAFSSSAAPNPKAIEMIAAQTLTAKKSGSTLAEKPELDLLLRIAGTRQIGEAFQRAGYKSIGKKRLFVVAASEGDGAALAHMSKRLTKDERFAKVSPHGLTKEDFENVERAALLAAKL